MRQRDERRWKSEKFSPGKEMKGNHEARWKGEKERRGRGEVVER